MNSFVSMGVRSLCKKKFKVSSILLGFPFIATILLGMVFSFQVQACMDPPSSAPGPSTSTGSGYLRPLSSPGTTYILAGSGGSSYNGESATDIWTTSGGGSFSFYVGGCSRVIDQVIGTYTATQTNETYTDSDTAGYAAAADIGIDGVIASPKNNGQDDLTNSAPNNEGDPFKASTGNLYHVFVDFVGPASTHLELKRYYNSQNVMSSPFGRGWTSTYDRRVNALSSTYAQLLRSDGHMDTFSLVGGAWTGDPDVTSTLTAVMSGGSQVGWRVVTKDDTTENYNMSGQLTSVVTRAGLTTNLTYNSSNQLSVVTGPFGHSLTYTYNANGNVATVTIPDGGVLSYAYDSKNNLTSTTYPDTTSQTYTYANSSYPNSMTSIIDELGNTYVSWAYGSSPYFPSANGLVVSSQLAGGAYLTTASYGYSGVTITDPNSNTHTYSFTTQFGVVKPTSLTGQPVATVGGKSFSYDSNGFISSKTDYDNNVTNYTHDARGDETSRTEAYGTSLARTISTTWHSTFHLPLTITEPNRTTTFTYDSNGNMLTKSIVAGSSARTWTYTYNANGQVLTAMDPNSNVTAYAYNTNGTMASVTDALSHVTHFTSYDADGKLLSMTDPNGLVTSFTYDSRGRLKTRAVGTEVTSYTYDNAGNLTKVTQPDSSYLNYTYDAAHRLTGVADALGNSIAYTLDANSNVTAKKIYNSGSTLAWQRTFTYDSVERLKTAVGAYTGETTTYGYDSESNLTSVTDPLSHAFAYAYDALNRRNKVTNPNSGVTQYGYDSNDHVTSLTDPRNLVTSYTVTGLDNVTGITSPDTGSTGKTYDNAGNVLTSTDANGNTVTYTYDALNRVTNAAYTGGINVSYTYDTGTNGIGHITSMTDPSGTTTWTYDQHGRVTQKQQTTGSVVLTTAYAYDSYGRLSTVTYPSGKTITLAYDAAGRVSSISSGGTALVSLITYLPFGPVTGWTEGNGATYSRSLDLDGRITGITIGSTASNPAVTTLAYTPDTANRITGLTETGFANKTFGYDALDRLTSFVNGTATTSYGYDADSNRTSLTVPLGTTTYSYPSSSNKLSGLSGLTSASYSYDSDGNITSDGTNNWAYDARNRMSSNTVSSIATSYGVNGLNQRVTKSGAGVSPAGLNEYVYDEEGHLLGDYDNSGNALTETLWLGNLPVAVLTGTGVSAASYYINPDNLNAPHIITDGNGNQVWTWDHLAFGDNAPNQNPSGLGVFNYNPRFPGQYADAESGLNYNMRRDYNPSLGRYVESDPTGLRGGINTYAYVNGSPTLRIDMYGLCADGYKTAQEFPPIVDEPPVVTEEPVLPPLQDYPTDPTQSPGLGYEWRGAPGSQPGDSNGNWYNPNTGESLRPDTNHPQPIGPHWDYKSPEGNWYRWFENGQMVGKSTT